MEKEQILTEIKLIEYSFYYNQPDTYLKQRLIEKKDNFESLSGKLRWEKDLKIWKLEQAQSLIQLINSSDYKKESLQQTMSNQNNNAGSLESQNKQFIKQQTFSRWQNNDIKKQETQDIQFYNKSLKTQYNRMRRTLKTSHTDKLMLRNTFNQTPQNATNIENQSFPIQSKHEIIILYLKEIFQFQAEKGFQEASSLNKQNPLLKFSQQDEEIIVCNVLPNQEDDQKETDCWIQKENKQAIHISKEVLSILQTEKLKNCQVKFQVLNYDQTRHVQLCSKLLARLLNHILQL
ncbi:hypothetical protein ABPG72_017885 [Tetrahymena utriculariae]